MMVGTSRTTWWSIVCLLLLAIVSGSIFFLNRSNCNGSCLLQGNPTLPQQLFEISFEEAPPQCPRMTFCEPHHFADSPLGRMVELEEATSLFRNSDVPWDFYILGDIQDRVRTKESLIALLRLFGYRGKVYFTYPS